MPVQAMLQAARRRASATVGEPSPSRANALNQGSSRLVRPPANTSTIHGIREANTGAQFDDILRAHYQNKERKKAAHKQQWQIQEAQLAQELSNLLEPYYRGRATTAPTALFPDDALPSLLQSTEAPSTTPPPLLAADDHHAWSDAASQLSLPTPTSVADPTHVAGDAPRPERLLSASPTPPTTVAPLPSRTESSGNAAGTKRRAPTAIESPSKRTKNQRLVKDRTITFEEVYGNGNPEHKYIIIHREYTHSRYAELRGKYWILRCKDHNKHFAREGGPKSVIMAASRHVLLHDNERKRNGQSKSSPNKNSRNKNDQNKTFLASFEAFGVVVEGCSVELMRKNNDFVISSLSVDGPQSLGTARSHNESGAEASNPIVIPSEDELESSTEYEALTRPQAPNVVRQPPTGSSLPSQLREGDISTAVKQEDIDNNRPAAPESRSDSSHGQVRPVQARAPQRRAKNTTGQALPTLNMQSPSRSSSMTLGRGQPGQIRSVGATGMNRLAAPPPQPVASDIPSEADRRREDRDRNRDAASEVTDLYGATPPPERRGETPKAPEPPMEPSVTPQPLFSAAPERSAAQLATARMYRQRLDELEPMDTWNPTRQLCNGA